MFVSVHLLCCCFLALLKLSCFLFPISISVFEEIHFLVFSFLAPIIGVSNEDVIAFLIWYQYHSHFRVLWKLRSDFLVSAGNLSL